MKALVVPNFHAKRDRVKNFLTCFFMRTQTFGFNHVFDFNPGDPQFFSLSSLSQSRLQIVSRYPHVKTPTSSFGDFFRSVVVNTFRNDIRSWIRSQQPSSTKDLPEFLTPLWLQSWVPAMSSHATGNPQLWIYDLYTLNGTSPQTWLSRLELNGII